MSLEEHMEHVALFLSPRLRQLGWRGRPGQALGRIPLSVLVSHTSVQKGSGFRQTWTQVLILPE